MGTLPMASHLFPPRRLRAPGAGGKGKATLRAREEIDERYRWELADIFPDRAAWEAACGELERRIEEVVALKGTLSQSAARLLDLFRLSDELGQLAHRVWYWAALRYDEDQRDNGIGALRQQVQALMAKWSTATAWVNPEILAIGRETLRAWLAGSEDLALYRFALEDLFRKQEHVLDEAGEQLLSYAARFRATPSEAYQALSTADIRYPTIVLSDGEEVTVTYGRYRAILATRREQKDRAAAFEALYTTFEAALNTYAALYNGVCQRSWFYARARKHPGTLEAALFGDNIPREVVETLIAVTRGNTEPLRRYHRLRKRALGLESYHLYDGSIPLVELERLYPYDKVSTWILDSVAPLGGEYREKMSRAFTGRWIDVYENEGKRSGAYSAGVYGVHPYMLLNYNDTLDDLFTLAHELGHTMHTLLAYESQPFVYADYSIFVAEVASTLNEALLLDTLLAHSEDPRERAVLLQHAIDTILGTYYSQVLFAEFEWKAHRLAEEGKPITAEALNELYSGLLQAYYGDAVDLDDLYRITWARIPHFYGSPFYVYQYATSLAASAELAREIRRAGESERGEVVRRIHGLLRAGGSDYPMELLRRAGVDLSRPEPFRAVGERLDRLVGRLEEELTALGVLPNG